MSEYEFWTLHLRILTQYSNHMSICCFISITPPTNYTVTLIKPFSFVWYVIPTVKNRGLSIDLWSFPTVLTMKNIKKCRSHVPFMLLDIILTQWWRPVASSKALDLLYQAICVVMYRCIATAIKMASFVCVFVDCCLSWQPLGRYGASSCPMAVSSGFRSSPGHAALGDAICIALVHHHGHQNGQWMRCICLSLLPCLNHNT